MAGIVHRAEYNHFSYFISDHIWFLSKLDIRFDADMKLARKIDISEATLSIRSPWNRMAFVYFKICRYMVSERIKYMFKGDTVSPTVVTTLCLN